MIQDCRYHHHEIVITVSQNSRIQSCLKWLISPSAVYMRQWTRSALFQVMACRLFGAQPLPEPMLLNFLLDSRVQISVNFASELHHFHSRKCIRNCRWPRCRPFCPGWDGLIATLFVFHVICYWFVMMSSKKQVLSSDFACVLEYQEAYSLVSRWCAGTVLHQPLFSLSMQNNVWILCEGAVIYSSSRSAGRDP